jgi:hypothetical protein
VSAPQAPLPADVAVFTGLVAFAAVAFDLSWKVVRHVMVMAHEGMHGIFASLLGQGVQGITMDAKGEGGTKPKRAAGRLGTSSVAFVGYLGPSAFGLGAAKLIELGDITAMFWVALFLLLILLLAVRWSFGFITVIGAGVLVFLIAVYTPIRTQEIAAYLIAWLLLLSGVRIIIEHGLSSGDGGILKSTTYIPHLIWSLLWLAGSIAAVIVGGSLLVTGG